MEKKKKKERKENKKKNETSLNPHKLSSHLYLLHKLTNFRFNIFIFQFFFNFIRTKQKEKSKSKPNKQPTFKQCCVTERSN